MDIGILRQPVYRAAGDQRPLEALYAAAIEGARWPSNPTTTSFESASTTLMESQ